MANNPLTPEQIVDLLERKAEQFVTAAVGNAASRAMSETPREYGNLANSQFTRVLTYPNVFVGKVGYMTDYAKYLNGLPGYRTPTWNPRPVNEKQGPSANMNAKPGFLTNAFESQQSQAEIDDLARTILRV